MTVNFDELIETGLSATHQVFVEASEYPDAIALIDERLNGRPAPVPILKLHGTATDSETMIANIDETEYGLADEVRAALTRLTVAGPVTWVWVGCSMRDRDVSAWLGGLGADVLDDWWVDPMPGSSLDEFVAGQRRAYWDTFGRRLDDRLIIAGADVFLSELLAHARAL